MLRGERLLFLGPASDSDAQAMRRLTIQLVLILTIGQIVGWTVALALANWLPPGYALLLIGSTLPWLAAFDLVRRSERKYPLCWRLVYALWAQTFLLALLSPAAIGLGIFQTVEVCLFWWARRFLHERERPVPMWLQWLFPMRGRWLAYGLPAVLLLTGAGLVAMTEAGLEKLAAAPAAPRAFSATVWAHLGSARTLAPHAMDIYAVTDTRTTRAPWTSTR
jgi:hypothetical protein